MKVELQCGDTIAIPEGCKATIKNGSVVFEKEEKKEQEFKDGDILIITENEHRYCVFIYKNTDGCGFHSFYVGINIGNTLTISKSLWQRWGNYALLDYATDKEKQELFDKMKEQGLRWNAKEKRVEKINWRAERGKKYFVSGCSGNLGICIENDCIFDNHLYEFGNYFRTKEQAKKAAEAVRETLRKLHEEMGE